MPRLALAVAEAIPAIDRPAGDGAKRDLGGPAAIRAGGREGLARAGRRRAGTMGAGSAPLAPGTLGPLGLALIPAALAARGRVGEPALPIERLLARGEQKFLAAAHARESLIFIGRHDATRASGGADWTRTRRENKAPRQGSNAGAEEVIRLAA